MATVIQIKRSANTTAPSTLKLGELAYTYGTGTQGNLGDRMFIGIGGVDGNGDANEIAVIGGQYFSDKLDHVDGTLTGSSAIIVDSNLAINTLNIGNATTTGGEISFNEGTNNGTNFIGLKAPNAVTTSKTFVLPDGDGTAGQFLKTDGSGNLDFATVNQFITLSDGSATDQYNTAETLLFTGGQSITTAVTDNEITFSVTAGSIDTTQLTDSGVTNAKLSTGGQTTLGSSTLTLGATTTDIAGLTSLVVDSITINGSTVSTTSGNTDITLAPHGTGTVKVPAAYKDRAGFDSDSLTTKAYVDEVATGLDVKDSVLAATTVNLTATYSNGTAGVGATLTNSGTQAALVLDGITLNTNDRVLVKDETVGNRERNGVYTVTDTGSGSTNWVLTRAQDTDEASELTGGSFVFVETGTANGGNGFVFTHVGQPTLGTTELPVSQFSGAGQIDAGDAIVKAGNRLDVNTDNSSIEVNADALRVKDGGITNAMLAGSIDGAKIENFVFTDESSTQGAVQIGNAMNF